MKTMRMRQQLIAAALAGAIMVPGSAVTVFAADDTAESDSKIQTAGIEKVLKGEQTDINQDINLYLVPTQTGEYLNMAFSNVSDFAYIRSAPEEESDWVGKLYGNTAVEVEEYTGDWTKIRSGTVEGYVLTNDLYIGNEAKEHAGEYEQKSATVTADVLNVRDGQGTGANILAQVLQNEQYAVTGEAVDGWYPIQAGEVSGWVSGEYVIVDTQYAYAESREDEETRLAQEEADRQEEARIAEEQAQAAREAQQQAEALQEVQAQETAAIQTQTASGQAVIDYACQFIGNPYVWGGTSLTDGADCSGFVQSVYSHFGISLPRTTWDMENIGTPVSYEEAIPGDIVLYDGHVGLYMGDGNIVNAMNEADGIGICSATYTGIVTIRRVI